MNKNSQWALLCCDRKLLSAKQSFMQSYFYCSIWLTWLLSSYAYTGGRVIAIKADLLYRFADWVMGKESSGLRGDCLSVELEDDSCWHDDEDKQRWPTLQDHTFQP